MARSAGRIGMTKPVYGMSGTTKDLLQRWPVSKRVNSSRAPDDDPTLIDPIS
jgi:hypothetical protein